MPPRKAKRTTKKRAGKRTLVKYRKSIPLIMPDKFLNRMRYSEAFALDPGAGSIASYLFNANGIYDPNESGIGHQPTGFDVMMNIYYEWIVLGARCKVIFTSQSNTATGLAYCGVALRNSTSSIADVDEAIENKNGSYSLLGSYYSKPGTTVVKNFSAKKFFGSKFISSDADLKGSDSGDPPVRCYFHVWAGSIGGSTDPASLYARVAIDYTVLWSRRRGMATS